MLKRHRLGMHCLLFLVAMMAIPVIGFQRGVAWAQATPGEIASPEGASQRAATSKPVDCGELAGLIQQERTAVAREMGQIKREIAALRDDLSKPGLKEIFAGIGYILGLAGVGLYAHCRRNKVVEPGASSQED